MIRFVINPTHTHTTALSPSDAGGFDIPPKPNIYMGHLYGI